MRSDTALTPLIASLKPSAKLAEQLSRDACAFDVAVVRSVLAFVNIALGVPDRPAPTPAGLATCFRWIPAVLRLRAELCDIDAGTFNADYLGELLKFERATVPEDRSATPWKPKSRKPDPADVHMIAVDTANMLVLPSVDGRTERTTAPTWLNELLRKLAIYTRFAATRNGIIEVSVPVLNTFPAVLAYAVAVVHSDRHGLRGRVRPCKYGYPARAHYFLDYRRDAAGMVRGQVQYYCCPAHSNRDRQARHKGKLA